LAESAVLFNTSETKQLLKNGRTGSIKIIVYDMKANRKFASFSTSRPSSTVLDVCFICEIVISAKTTRPLDLFKVVYKEEDARNVVPGPLRDDVD
jgi:hypothetical protein